MNVNTGIPRILQTLHNFFVCASTPFAPSITITALSTEVSMRYVSSPKSLCPGVSIIEITFPEYSNCITDDVTDIPLCFSISIQSDVENLELCLPFTVPASRIAPPCSKSFSVNVVLPASGWEMIPNILRFCTSLAKFVDITISFVLMLEEIILFIVRLVNKLEL